MEDLTNIRSSSRVTVRKGKGDRDRHSKWAFGESRNFVAYKAKKEGVPLGIVKSKNTSRQCPSCEYIDQRNRKSRNSFECLSCGYRGEG